MSSNTDAFHHSGVMKLAKNVFNFNARVLSSMMLTKSVILRMDTLDDTQQTIEIRFLIPSKKYKFSPFFGAFV